MFRQGDLLIVEAPEVPGKALRLDHCTLALGESTGHSHRIETGAEQYVDEGGVQYVRVVGPTAELIHEEHGTIVLTGPAVYRVVRQREYQPAAPTRTSFVHD